MKVRCRTVDTVLDEMHQVQRRIATRAPRKAVHPIAFALSVLGMMVVIGALGSLLPTMTARTLVRVIA